MKYIVVMGTVMSGIGKGVTASSIGVVLQAHGYRVTAIKIDPYLNMDSGTMSPFEHGECYVLDDGGECDLDLGNYERFLGVRLTRDHNITTGKIYGQVIEAERRGDYLGKTVQIVPHVTGAIQEWIERVARVSVGGVGSGEPDVCIVELGGTVGDLESDAYVEALRGMAFEMNHGEERSGGDDQMVFVNVTYIPVLAVSEETKTKPAQHGVKELRRRGINPDLMVVRSDRELEEGSIGKLMSQCQIEKGRMFFNVDVEHIYQVPLEFRRNGRMYAQLAKLLGLDLGRKDDGMKRWVEINNMLTVHRPFKMPTVYIAVVGKYTGLTDSYLSLSHAIKHGGLANGVRVDIRWIDSKGGDNVVWEVEGVDGVVIPGGFGVRGLAEKIAVAKWCREEGVPCLGICLGFQVMVIEWCRNVMGIKGATSQEFRGEDGGEEVLCIIDEDSVERMGGSMRLGLSKIELAEGSQVKDLYDGMAEISERHRHRYEVNPKWIDRIEESGLRFSGRSEDGKRMEVAELAESDRFYLGTQFHGEYLTNVNGGRPVFKGLISACVK